MYKLNDDVQSSDYSSCNPYVPKIIYSNGFSKLFWPLQWLSNSSTDIINQADTYIYNVFSRGFYYEKRNRGASYCAHVRKVDEGQQVRVPGFWGSGHLGFKHLLKQLCEGSCHSEATRQPQNPPTA